jgi:hypothetical protein
VEVAGPFQIEAKPLTMDVSASRPAASQPDTVQTDEAF